MRLFNTEVEDRAFLADPGAVHQVELRQAERRRDLVLDDLGANAVADDLGALLDGVDASHVDANGRVELEGTAAAGRLRTAEHDADLLAELVDEDARGVRAAERARELAQRLTHEPRLEADRRVAHLAFEFSSRNERGD